MANIRAGERSAEGSVQRTKPSVGYIHIHTYLCIFHRSSGKPIGDNEPFLPQGTEFESAVH